jgi:hypothetical protein
MSQAHSKQNAILLTQTKLMAVYNKEIITIIVQQNI